MSLGLVVLEKSYTSQSDDIKRTKFYSITYLLSYLIIRKCTFLVTIYIKDIKCKRTLVKFFWKFGESQENIKHV